MNKSQHSEPGSSYVAGPILDGHLDGASTWRASDEPIPMAGTVDPAICRPGPSSPSSASSSDAD